MQYTRILALGDSETYGARATHGRTYPAILEERLSLLHTNVPSIVLNRGNNGERSWEIVDRGVDYLLADDWIRICICMMGTNDAKPSSDTPVHIYMSQWDRLLRACRATDTTLYALEIPAIDPVGQPEYDEASVQRILAFNTFVRTWCERNDVTYIGGLFDRFVQNPDLLADGIHPNNTGNDLIAQRVYDVLGQPRRRPRASATAEGGTAINITNIFNGASGAEEASSAPLV